MLCVVCESNTVLVIYFSWLSIQWKVVVVVVAFNHEYLTFYMVRKVMHGKFDLLSKVLVTLSNIKELNYLEQVFEIG